MSTDMQCYALMSPTERTKLNKKELLCILDTQVPAQYASPEDQPITINNMRNAIRDMILPQINLLVNYVNLKEELSRSTIAHCNLNQERTGRSISVRRDDQGKPTSENVSLYEEKLEKSVSLRREDMNKNNSNDNVSLYKGRTISLRKEESHTPPRESIQQENFDLKEMLGKTIDELIKLKKRMMILEDKNKHLEKEVNKHQSFIECISKDQQMKRLTISGIPERSPIVIDDKEGTTDWKKINMLCDYLQLNFRPERCCRLNFADGGIGEGPRPMMVEFSKYSDRNTARDKFRKLKNSENETIKNINAAAVVYTTSIC